jgi:hypothetical protein
MQRFAEALASLRHCPTTSDQSMSCITSPEDNAGAERVMCASDRWKNSGAAPGHTSSHMSLRAEQLGKWVKRSASSAPQPNGHSAVGPAKRPVVVHALQIVRKTAARAHGGATSLAA